MCSQVYPHHSHPVWLFSSILNCWFLECCLLKLPFTSILPDTPKSSAVLSVCPMIPFPLLDLVVCFHVLCLWVSCCCLATLSAMCSLQPDCISCYAWLCPSHCLLALCGYPVFPQTHVPQIKQLASPVALGLIVFKLLLPFWSFKCL